MKKTLIFILGLFIFASQASAQEFKPTKKRFERKYTMYFHPAVGSSDLDGRDAFPTGVPEGQKDKDSFAPTAILGFRFKKLAFEIVVADLGTPSTNMGVDYYTEKHDASFYGGGIRYTFLDVLEWKFGVGTIRDRVEFKPGNKVAASFSVTPNNQTHVQGTTYFGIGANVDLSKRVEMVIDGTAYLYNRDTTDTYNINGVSTTLESNGDILSVLSLGLRFYL